MNEPAIEIRGLQVRARRRPLLTVERLDVPRGAFLGVLGPNGAGKSTLLETCLGLRPRAAGEVTVLGQPLNRLGLTARARLRQRIGYVPQRLAERSEIPLTVREVVAIGRSGVRGLLCPLTGDDHRIIDGWLDRLGLAELAGRGYGEISGGQQRKTLIARAMVQQPEILMLDEPTANLDLGWRERIVALVQELHADRRLTVILVCHELEVLPPACGRVVVLRDGRILADGPPEAVLHDGLMEALYGPGLSVRAQAGRYLVVPGGTRHA